MKFVAYRSGPSKGLAVETGSAFRGYPESHDNYPGSLTDLVGKGGNAFESAAEMLRDGDEIDVDEVVILPPFPAPEKIVCVGLNYSDHSAETGFDVPSYPTLFGRFNSTLIGHKAAIARPPCSQQLDYEGELVAIMGAEARNVSESEALDYVAGYSIFNDCSVRDYQFKTPQWMPGKNFDETGAFGPFFVTADSLPRGCAGLRLRTRLNGQLVQDASIDDMVFSVAALISTLSRFMTLKSGDVIVTGTPSGVGMARSPQLFMKDGDVCEVEIEGIGTLVNPVRDRAA